MLRLTLSTLNPGFKIHETVKSYGCQKSANTTPPCCICLTDIERWHKEEFLSDSAIRRPLKNSDGEFMVFKGDIALNNINKAHEEEREKLIAEMSSTIDDYANRCREYGNLSLAVLDHLHSLDYVICPEVCLDHLIRFETIGKIFFILGSYKEIKNRGYIQVTESIYKRALSKLETILKDYDYSHFLPEPESCDHCMKYDLAYTLIFLMRSVYFLTQIAYDGKLSVTAQCNNKSAEQIDAILHDITSKMPSLLENEGESNSKILAKKGKNFYKLINVYDEMYSKNPYSYCTLDAHHLYLPLKIVYTNSTMNQKIDGRTLATMMAGSPSESCAICHESLNTAKNVSVSRFCRHIFCGDCFLQWNKSTSANNRSVI